MSRLDSSIEAIQANLCSQAERVESMVRTAYRGLCERCLGTADQVMSLEAAVDATEVEIEEQCLQLLALQQPVAIDLRRVAGVLKVNNDLERIADLSLDLARHTESLTQHPDLAIPPELTEMVAIAIKMLRDANQAFVQDDVVLARDVCSRDSDLDRRARHTLATIVDAIETNASLAAGYLHVFSATRIVERIGDLTTNIAEDAEYIVSGDIARHRHASDMPVREGGIET